MSLSLTLACSSDSFPHIGLPCPASIGRCPPCLTVSCFILFGCHLLEACYFLKRKWRKSGSEGEERYKRNWEE